MEREQIIKEMQAMGLTFDGLMQDLMRARDAYSESLTALEKMYPTLTSYEAFSRLKVSISHFDELIAYYRKGE
jgi:hypothetical protein